MGPELIWPNTTIGVNIILEEILALRTIRHVVRSNRATVQTKI